MVQAGFLRELAPGVMLALFYPQCHRGQIGRDLRQVVFGLGQQRRELADRALERLKVVGRERQISGDPHGALHGLFETRNGAIEPGIARPGSDHPMVKVESVHFGADDVVVHLVAHGPALDVHGSQALLVQL